jgi:hypothetical protein
MIKKLLVLSTLILFINTSSFSQSNYKIPVNNRVVLNFIEYVVYVDVLTTEKKIKPNDELYYFWFKGDNIKRTRGGFEGKLLHGEYIEFYANKDLKEKGNFIYGLKTGEWKKWYPEGQLECIIRWRNGTMKGKFIQFDLNGDVCMKGYYKDNKLNGKIITYSSEGSVLRYEKYSDGKLITGKQKSNKIRGKKNKEKEKIIYNKEQIADTNKITNFRTEEPLNENPVDTNKTLISKDQKQNKIPSEKELRDSKKKKQIRKRKLINEE